MGCNYFFALSVRQQTILTKSAHIAFICAAVQSVDIIGDEFVTIYKYMYTCTKEYKKNYYTVIYAVDLFYKILRFLLFLKS